MRTQIKHFLAASVFVASALVFTSSPYIAEAVHAQNVYAQTTSEEEFLPEEANELAKASDFVLNEYGDLIEYKGAGGDVVIPSTVKGICEGVFERNNTITSVVIPSSVRYVDRKAFYMCTGLSKVTFSEGLSWIGGEAFYRCNIASLTFPDSLTNIGTLTFAYNGDLEKLDLHEGITNLGDGAFSGCTSLKSATIPSTLNTVPGALFYDCTSLEKVVISDGVTNINHSVFYGGAFEGCTALKSVTIPRTVEEIDESSFKNCKSLTSITIPSGVTTIGISAFSDCTSLEKIYIPKSVTLIADHVFYNDKKLTIYGITGSEAQKCAKLDSIPFKITLDAVSKLKVTVKDGNCASLSWEKVSGAQGYIVYKATGTGSFAYAGMTSSLSYSDKNVTKGNTYSYKIYPYFTSNGVRELGPTDITKSVKILNASAGLKVTSTTNNSVSLSWNKTTGADGYIIYRRVADGSFKYLYMVSGTTYTDKTATNYQYNFYRVYPYYKDADGNRILGASGSYVYARPIPSVTGLKAVGNKGNVTISWNKTANTTGYFVYRKDSSGKFVYVGMSTGSSFVDKAASKTSYNFYRVYPYYKATANSDRIMGKSLAYVYAKAK